AGQVHGYAASLEQREQIRPPPSRGDGDGGPAVCAIGDGRVGCVVEQELDVFERVVATHSLVQGRVVPTGHAVGVGAVLEQKLDAVVIVPVGLAQQHRGEAVVAEPSAVQEGLHGAVVVGLGRVVGRLLVVGIGAALEQEAGQLGVVRDAGGAVQRAL